MPTETESNVFTYFENVPPAKVRLYDPVGRCIYCPTEQEPSSELGDEHIVPEGLGGEWVLRDASCRKHEGVTTRFEGLVLRHVLIEARTYLKLPTKRPKERPTHFRLKLLDKEGQETETLQAIGDKPVPLALPVLKYPRLLRNMPKINESPVDHFWVVIWWPKQGMSNKDYYGTENSSYDFTVEWGRFCRMLAKIGYSYAVAELGFGSFEPLVLDTILGTEDYDSIGHYVGGYIDYDPPSKERHELDLLRYQVGSARYWVAKIRLFAWLGAPTYFVVVGSAK